jgi:four helix bundle protein
MKESILGNKSFEFSKRIVFLYEHLVSDTKKSILAAQVLRSGTSIGANVEEALGAQSKKEFISKLSTSLKEARETRYWLKLMKDTKFINLKLADSLINDCEELLKLTYKIRKTASLKNK